MANVQLENGAIQIAHDLHIALMRFDFTALELRVVMAVMQMTYGLGKTKAEITAEDVRYMLGGDRKLRTDRIAAVLVKLNEQKVLFSHELNGKQIVGIQKDYDLWCDKMSPLINKLNTNTSNSYIYSADKASPPERLLAYAQKRSKFRHSLGTYKSELKYAKQLYIEALGIAKSPLDALYLLRDFIDQDDWMRDNVKMQMTYMASRFGAWATQIPRKTRAVLEDEEITGKRFRYNVKTKRWEVAE